MEALKAASVCGIPKRGEIAQHVVRERRPPFSGFGPARRRDREIRRGRGNSFLAWLRGERDHLQDGRNPDNSRKKMPTGQHHRGIAGRGPRRLRREHSGIKSVVNPLTRVDPASGLVLVEPQSAAAVATKHQPFA
jgi:hypothetical protein